MAEHKPEFVASSSLIKVGGSNFYNMTDASQIDSLKASAPTFHGAIDRALKMSGKVRAKDPIVNMAESITIRDERSKTFLRGSPVIHKETGRKLTIIKASVGYTKHTHTPVHRVADTKGNVWLEKESKLKLRM